MPQQPSPTLAAAGLMVLGFLGMSVGAWIWALIQLASGRPLLPRAPVRRVPWGIWSIAGVIVLYLLVQVLVSLGYGFAHPGLRGRGLRPRDIMTIVTATNVVVLLLVPIFLRASSGARLGDLGLTSPRPLGDLARGAVGWLMVTPVVYLVMAGVVTVFGRRQHPLEDLMNHDLSPSAILLTFGSAVLVSPAAEELLFRGVLLGWLVRLWTRPKEAKKEEDILFLDELPILSAADYEEHRARFAESPWEAPSAPLAPPPRPAEGADDAPTGLALWMPNVFVSLLFAALHGSQWPAPIPLFFLSLVFGYLTLRTGNLLASFTFHALFNGTSTTALFLVLWQRVQGGG